MEEAVDAPTSPSTHISTGALGIMVLFRDAWHIVL